MINQNKNKEIFLPKLTKLLLHSQEQPKFYTHRKGMSVDDERTKTHLACISPIKQSMNFQHQNLKINQNIERRIIMSVRKIQNSERYNVKTAREEKQDKENQGLIFAKRDKINGNKRNLQQRILGYSERLVAMSVKPPFAKSTPLEPIKQPVRIPPKQQQLTGWTSQDTDYRVNDFLF